MNSLSLRMSVQFSTQYRNRLMVKTTYAPFAMIKRGMQ